MPSVKALPPLLATALLAACSSSPPPPASPASPPVDPQATMLRDTIQKPIDKAKGVEGIINKSKVNQDQQLQSAEGDAASPP